MYQSFYNRNRKRKKIRRILVVGGVLVVIGAEIGIGGKFLYDRQKIKVSSSSSSQQISEKLQNSSAEQKTSGLDALQKVKNETNQDPKEQAQQLFSLYIEDLQKKQYGEIYQQISKKVQSVISLEDFTERYEKIYQGMGATDITVQIQSVNEETEGEVTLDYQMSMNTVAGKLDFSNQAVYEIDPKDGAALKWDHDLILPNLGANDKVKVTMTQPQRGNILDRNGVLLAGEQTASSIGIVPGKLGENRQKDLSKLARLLDTDVESLEKKLSASWVTDDSFVPISTMQKVKDEELKASHLDKDVVKNYKLQQKLLKIPCVKIIDTVNRGYPLGKSASLLTGYVRGVTADELKKHPEEGYTSNSVIGKSGLELAYESLLRGKVGYQIEIVNSYGKQKQVVLVKPKENGKDLQLTIDANLQKQLYTTYEKDQSCSVAMNPYTGEVLALVSTPSFNANDFLNGITNEEWKKLNESKRKPMWNRFRATWCPGSSFKPVIAAVGTMEGAIDPTKDYGMPGLKWQKDKSWGRYYVTTLHSYQKGILKNALVYSDNIYFAKASLRIGAKKLVNQLKGLGLGEKMPFEIDLNQSQYSNTNSINSEIQLADSGYGQGQVLMNPIHLASIYTAFVNDGNMVTPHLVFDEGSEPEYWKKGVFSKEVSEMIKKDLVQVVEDEHGTGHGCKMSGVTLAGKTGTAELKATKEDKDGIELGWFVVFPINQKKEDTVLLLNMVEDVRNRGGSTYVVNKDQKILSSLYH